MRLIDVNSMKLVEFFDESRFPRYGILSHRWGSDELSFQDYQRFRVKRHPGYDKIAKFCQKVAAGGLQYAWVDTCCIDKTSSAELSESINSMFNWYQKADVCFIYLADVHLEDLTKAGMEIDAGWHRRQGCDAGVVTIIEDRVSRSAWFTRGWKVNHFFYRNLRFVRQSKPFAARHSENDLILSFVSAHKMTLQELLAPQIARFYDAGWQFFGLKDDLKDILSSRTGIEERYLSGDDMKIASIAKRMSWASERETTRIEDMAYCLLGIFGVNMPLLYGEGKKAFTRLQEEIMKESADQSLFAWSALEKRTESLIGPLAASPAEFANAGNALPYPDLMGNLPYAMTNQGLRMDVALHPHPSGGGLWLAILGCHSGQIERPLAIVIRPADTRIRDTAPSNQYGRFPLQSEPIAVTSEMLGNAETRTIYLKQSSIARPHDKTYTLDLRLAKSDSPASPTHNSEVKLLSAHPDCSILNEKDNELEWHATLATNLTKVALGITVNKLRYLLCVKVVHPETYLHDLDWWLRSQCKCRLVGGLVGALAWTTDPRRHDVVHEHTEELDNGNESWSAKASDPSFRFAVKVRKDFENGGVVLGLDFHFIAIHEMEAPHGVSELPGFLVPREDLLVGETSSRLDLDNEWPTLRETESTEVLLGRIFPPLTLRDHD